MVLTHANRRILLSVIFVALIAFMLALFLPAATTRADSPSQLDDELPLNPSLAWELIGPQTETILINRAQSSFSAKGQLYRSQPIYRKPAADIIEYYSSEVLATRGWIELSSAAGNLSIIGTFFHDPDRYLIVRLGDCEMVVPGNPTTKASSTSFCISVWGTSKGVYLPIPAIPTRLRPALSFLSPLLPQFSNPLPIPLLSQRDPSWQGDRLGFDESGYPGACNYSTIGSVGCWTTSYAMLYDYYQSGYTSPRNLNNNLNNGSTRYALGNDHCNNLMPGGSPYAPSGVARVDPYPGVYNACTTPNCIDSGNVSLLDSELNNGRPVLLYLHYSGIYPQHMVVLTGHSGSTYYINDPYATDTSQRTLTSGAIGNGQYIVDYIYRWSGTPPDGGCTPDTTAPDGEITSPSEGSTVNSCILNLGAWVSDSCTGINHAHVTGSWSGSWHIITPDFNSANYSYNWDMCSAGVPNGQVDLGLDIWDNAGNVAYSPRGVRHFTKNVTVTPSAPALSNPSNGGSYPYDYNLTFNWNSVPNATEYLIEWWGGPYSTMQPCGWTSSTSCPIGTVIAGNTYSWHVRARNGTVEGPWSATWTFTIQSQAPGAPTLSNPSNGGTYPYDYSLTFSWNSVANATEYLIEWWGGPYSTMQPCGWTSSTSCPIGTVIAGNTYSWHVRARNGTVEGPWSSTWIFTIQPQTPCYVLATSVSPAGTGNVNRSIQPNCSTDGSKYTSGTQVSLTAVPSGNNTFVNWSGDASGTSNPTNVTIDRDKNVTANFQPPVQATINASVTLEGRPTPPDPRWAVPLRVTLTAPGQTTPLYSFTPNTGNSGQFSLSDIPPGTYDVRVKHSHTLQNKVANVTLNPGANTINLGTLLEGDANDDNYVTLVDFSILASTFGKCAGTAGYDARADFNGDQCVTLLDFSLLAKNFGKAGQTIPAAVALRPMLAPPARRPVSGRLVLTPSTAKVGTGQVFRMAVQVRAGTQAVDGVQASLKFDPAILRVKRIIAGSRLPQVLLNRYDNKVGTIDFAAGTLSKFPTGSFTLMQVEFEALGPTTAAGTSVTFQTGQTSGSDITFGGQSVLAGTNSSTITVWGASGAR